MAGLLNASPVSSLYGSGNPKITDDQIRQYINTPGVTDNDVLNKALETGVNVNQISAAMRGNEAYTLERIDRYLSDRGMGRNQPLQMPEAAAVPAAVKFQNISISPQDTVQGQLAGILNNKNSPLNVVSRTFADQNSNKRGLLDSSLNTEAAWKAMIESSTPIAQQDASTNFSAKQTNAQGNLTADTFNADVASRTNMFNTGAAKDIYTAQMDTQNKLAIANIQAIAQDSGIMGDLGRTYMSLYKDIVSDPNMTPEVKTQSINNLQEQLRGLTGLLPSIQTRASRLTFGDPQKKEIGVSNTSTSGGASQNINVLNYPIEPSVIGNVRAYERQTGQKVDLSRVAPQALVEDLRGGRQSLVSGIHYLGSDGLTHARSPNAYDFPGLMKKYGVSSESQLFDKILAPVHPPGTMRADAPLFYVYR